MGKTSDTIIAKLVSFARDIVIAFNGSLDRGIFIEMINDSGADVVRGDALMLDAAKGRNYFDTSTGEDDDQIFGMAAEAIADGARGKVQTWGPTKYLRANGADDIAAGDFLSSYSAAGIWQKGTIGSGNCFAIACEAHTADSTVALDAFLLGSAR